MNKFKYVNYSLVQVKQTQVSGTGKTVSWVEVRDSMTENNIDEHLSMAKSFRLYEMTSQGKLISKGVWIFLTGFLIEKKGSKNFEFEVTLQQGFYSPCLYRN